jgi:hypothetical protein
MKRLPSYLRAISGVIGISLLFGCSGQVSPEGSAPAGTGNSNGGAGSSGGGASTGTGSTPGATGGAAVGGGGDVTPPGGVALSPGDPTSAGAKPLRLLTRREYLNTVKDLLGDTSLTAEALPEDDEDLASGFAFHTTGTVATLDSNLYRDAAEALARNAVAKIATLLPCAPPAASAEAACASTFVTTFGPKMYRRPLTATDATRLTSLYQTGRTTLSLPFADAIGLVIEGVLQSPEFLYHGEVDATVTKEGAVVKLGNYELANRLSYLVWGSMPDQALFDAASKGQLADTVSVETQVRRMLKDPRAAVAFSDFFTDWLDIDTLPDKPKDPAIYAMYNDQLTTAMSGELTSFVNAVVVNGTGSFDDLMTGTNSFANQALATLYGVTGVTGTAMKAVVMNPAQRSGILTMAGFMSVTGASDGTNPPRRGKAIYNKLLCGVLPPVPPVVPAPQPASAGGTTRQRFEAHSTNPCTGACHAAILDPLGYSLENYDGIGRYRTVDNKLPVDASVMLTLDGKATPIADGVSLAKAMASSQEVQNCFTRQWFRYALGRLDTADDAASVFATANKFKTAPRDVRELVVGLTTSRTFRYRSPATGEVLQ